MSQEEPRLPEDTPRIWVRPISADERSEWDRLMRAHHYLGLKALRAPRALACLRNFTMSLLHVPEIQAGLRALAAQVDKVLEMLRL